MYGSFQYVDQHCWINWAFAFLFVWKNKKNKKFTTVCKVDYTYKYHTTNTAKKIKEGDITLQSHRHYVTVVQSRPNITFFYFCCFIYVLFTCIVVLTCHCKLLSFFFYICCFVIANMPVNYVCCFATCVMWKQVNKYNYHPLISIYGPYGQWRIQGWPPPLKLHVIFFVSGRFVYKCMTHTHWTDILGTVSTFFAVINTIFALSRIVTHNN